MNKEAEEFFKPLLEKARKENLMFYQRYADLWFTPDELEMEHKRGRFVWYNSANWELISRKTRLEQLKELKEEQLRKINKEILKLTNNEQDKINNS
jgi:hypothetical protein